MKRILIQLREEMYLELIDAAAECYQRDERHDCTPEDFAKQCIESVLASRRLDRICELT